MRADTILTADDVIRAGACKDGVYAVLTRLAGKIAAAMPAEAILRLLRAEERGYVLSATQRDGYGSGSGYGSGYGYGYGYGYGSGYGYGYGYGDGYGYGSGYG
jgi:hypothetical protein